VYEKEASLIERAHVRRTLKLNAQGGKEGQPLFEPFVLADAGDEEDYSDEDFALRPYEAAPPRIRVRPPNPAEAFVEGSLVRPYAMAGRLPRNEKLPTGTTIVITTGKPSQLSGLLPEHKRVVASLEVV
jgi:hypothetical protein